MKQARKGFDVLEEVISEDNVVAMSEMVTLLEMKYLIRFIGEPMEQMQAIIERLNLTNNMRATLEYRMSGLSFPEIARMLDRCCSTVWECFLKMRQRYMAING